MGSFTSFILENKREFKDFLRVDWTKGKITGRFDSVRFIDKDSKQIVCFIPSIDITGYGETYLKAQEMLRFNMSEFFEDLFRRKTKKAETELQALGWHKKIF